MGAIQDIYLRYKAAGEQYVGRVACDLSIHSAKFGVLPSEIIIDDQLLDDVSNIKLGLAEEIYPSLSVSLKRIGWFLISSVYFHFHFLCKYLKQDHPFFYSMFFFSKE